MSYNNDSQAYSSILEKTILKKLGFLEIHSIFHLQNYEPGEIAVDIKNDCEYQESDNPNSYIGLDKYEITGKVKDNSIFTINTTIIIAIESKEKLEREFLKTFAETNQKLITYPYLRQAVQDLTAKMGLPPMMLPLWHGNAKIQKRTMKSEIVANIEQGKSLK